MRIGVQHRLGCGSHLAAAVLPVCAGVGGGQLDCGDPLLFSGGSTGESADLDGGQRCAQRAVSRSSRLISLQDHHPSPQ